MPGKPVVLTLTAGAVAASLALAGGLLGQATATPDVGSVVTVADPSPSTMDQTTPPEPTAHPEPSPVYQNLGVVDRPRLTGGSGPYGAIANTSTAGVALTFDDGPDPTWTPRILALLRRASVRATFCLVGVHAQAFPELVQAIAADGHTLCNHSWNHNTALGSLGADAIRADLSRTSDAIRAAAPEAPIVYYRQPGGVWTQTVVNVAKEMGMASLHWEIDTNDWTIPPVTTIITEVTAGCTDGTVILMHDGGGNRANSVAAVKGFLAPLTRTHHFVPLPTGDA